MILDLYRVNLSLSMLTFTFSYRKCLKYSYSLNHWSKGFMMFWEEGKVIAVFWFWCISLIRSVPHLQLPHDLHQRELQRERGRGRERGREGR